MSLVFTILFYLNVASGGPSDSIPEAAPLQPTIALDGLWSVSEVSEGEWEIRHQNHPARLVVSTTGIRPGLTLKYQGRPLEVTAVDPSIPLLSTPFTAKQLSSFSITNQGIDLLVRLEGPSINEWTGQLDAPHSPVLSWFRVRVRDQRWRFILQGVAIWSLPADSTGPKPTIHPTDGIWISHPLGDFQWTTNAEASISLVNQTYWRMDVSPSISVRQPYPESALEWTPKP